MADGVFNIGLGAVAEKFRDGAANGIVMLLKANEAESSLMDREDLAELLAQGGTTEADFTNYARKTGLTGTVTEDHVNDRVDVDLPDQTWPNAGGTLDNTLTKAVVAYEDSAADSGRVPQTHHDFPEQTTGGDLAIQFNAAGFYRASQGT